MVSINRSLLGFEAKVDIPNKVKSGGIVMGAQGLAMRLENTRWKPHIRSYKTKHTCEVICNYDHV